MNFSDVIITSPKRVRKRPSGWDAFFPYYAGYPASFASKLIGSAGLDPGARVYDPWNGSGTTTFAATEHNLDAIGIDLNPAMVIIARARSLQPGEADSLMPLVREILKQAEGVSVSLDNEPLCQWFDDETASAIRALEMNIRHLLVGDLVTSRANGRLDRISPVASTFYVALFAACRSATIKFRTSNPTWFKHASKDEDRISAGHHGITAEFEKITQAMADSLVDLTFNKDRGSLSIYLGDSVDRHVDVSSVDFVLTSPPYCTRIDYTSATRIELALVSPLLDTSYVDLGRKMVGSTRVPTIDISVKDSWGHTCLKFIDDITRHSSKASAGYYRKTHLDYFDKMDRSIGNIASVLKAGGGAVVVVQDSYYKEIHNDLPLILTEIAESHYLKLERRDDFLLSATIAASHPHSVKYKKPRGATESVLCFVKSSNG